jgi:hypothetical protein
METSLNFSDLLSQAISQPGIISQAYSAFHNFSLGNQKKWAKRPFHTLMCSQLITERKSS